MAVKQSVLYPLLFASPCGRVYLEGGRELKASQRGGYMYVSVTINGRNIRAPVHRVVASAYCDGCSPDLFVNHINGIKADNRAENLEWVTASENMKHARNVLYPHQTRGERNAMAKLSEAQVVEIYKRSQTERTALLAAEFGVSRETIRNVKTSNKWKHVPRVGGGGVDPLTRE